MEGDWTDRLRESGEGVGLMDRLRSHLQFSATVAVLLLASAVCMNLEVVREFILSNVTNSIKDNSFVSALLITLYMVTTLAALAIVLGKMGLCVRSYLQSVRMDTALRIYGRFGSSSSDLVSAGEEARKVRMLLLFDLLLVLLAMAVSSASPLASMAIIAADILCFGLLWRCLLRLKNVLTTQNI